ncbi:phosphopantothenoylcysteine decarboxylase [Streptomyces rectiverticillatus]|uniref:peptide terminal cysteine decarboxylase LxmD n=1 Tax=Streptomyces rectiverticillatus TaxID=173860 RepID=UPI0015C3916F|nr:peptide terminal cysteine decarboxylase LxmD [Streptomyces rectiverticillatus]QLE72818.1 phosphopantothenoylcysteine decarboxylase [Streptomyces rectiverticillatus]
MEIPDAGFRRVLVVGTGALSVSFLPFWINWLQDSFPALEKRIALTRSARRFVSPDAIAALSRQDVFTDDWDSAPPGKAPHVELAAWADLVLVHPATVHFLSRYALGLADTPVLLALQTTRAVVGVAPALPPAAQHSPVVQGHLAALRARPGVVVAPTVPAESATTGERDDGGAAPMPELFRLCAAYKATLQQQEPQPQQDPEPQSQPEQQQEPQP